MGDSPSSHFLQCYAWLSVSRGWEAKRERETPPVCLPQGTLQLERTPLSFSSLPFSIPPFPFSLCRVACLSSLPCSIWAWEGWISPPCMSLDNIWIATGGGRGLETDPGSENQRKGKEISIASRGIPSLLPAACDP